MEKDGVRRTCDVVQIWTNDMAYWHAGETLRGQESGDSILVRPVCDKRRRILACFILSYRERENLIIYT